MVFLLILLELQQEQNELVSNWNNKRQKLTQFLAPTRRT